MENFGQKAEQLTCRLEPHFMAAEVGEEFGLSRRLLPAPGGFQRTLKEELREEAAVFG